MGGGGGVAVDIGTYLWALELKGVSPLYQSSHVVCVADMKVARPLVSSTAGML